MKAVVIIGRPNVGKSALFNRLAGRRVSIVHDQPGVTRDRITAVCRQGSLPFEIVDTGGIGAGTDPDFAVATRDAAEVGIAGADVLLLVVDAQSGITPLDADLASWLRSAGKPIILAVNKVDHLPAADGAVADFARLGIAASLPISAAHGLGINQLVRSICDLLPTDGANDDADQVVPRLAVVGRPNVGKSSLVNSIIGDQRSIVSEIAGTTRDAVDAQFEWGGHPFILCDTAGIRHRSKHDSSVEVFSVMRSEESIKRADLCLLVLDATQGVTAQDRKIAGLIQKAGKACLIALNKWDLVAPGNPRDRDGLESHLERARSEMFFLPFAPIVALSAKARVNVRRLLHQVEKIRQHSGRRAGTGELNRLLRSIIQTQPPPLKQNRRFKLLYSTQLIDENPRPFAPPRFLLFVNDPKLLTANYLAYLTNQIRKKWEYPGLPIHLKLRGRDARGHQ